MKKRILTAALALLVFLGGAAFVWGAFGGANETVPGVSLAASEPSQSPSADQAANVARIVCTGDSILIEDPVVRAQRDGVHLRFEDPGQWSEYSLHPDSFDYGQSEGANLSKEGPTTVTHSLPPGEVTVACVHARGSYIDREALTGQLTVLDPEGLFVPWGLECGWGEQFRARIAGRQDERVVEVFRRLRGVLASDVLAATGYPESPQMWPTRIVFRNGQAVARIMAPNVGDGTWELLVNACPGSGIERMSP
jgi:hypothetical protein